MITAGKECEDCRYYEPIDKFYNRCTARDKKYHYGQWVPCNDKLPLLEIPKEYKGLGTIPKDYDSSPKETEEIEEIEESALVSSETNALKINEERYKRDVRSKRSTRNRSEDVNQNSKASNKRK